MQHNQTPEQQQERIVDGALGVLQNLADRTNPTAYEAARARGRLPGEKALDFELRCLSESRGTLLDRMVRDYVQPRIAQGVREVESEDAAVLAYKARPAVQKIDRLEQLQRDMHMAGGGQ